MLPPLKRTTEIYCIRIPVKMRFAVFLPEFFLNFLQNIYCHY